MTKNEMINTINKSLEIRNKELAKMRETFSNEGAVYALSSGSIAKMAEVELRIRFLTTLLCWVTDLEEAKIIEMLNDRVKELEEELLCAGFSSPWEVKSTNVFDAPLAVIKANILKQEREYIRTKLEVK